MSKRAKKFIKFMEDSFDWSCIDRRNYCAKCMEKTIGLSVKFCSNCGSKLPNDRNAERRAIEEVETGLKEAFGETND